MLNKAQSTKHKASLLLVLFCLISANLLAQIINVGQSRVLPPNVLATLNQKVSNYHTIGLHPSVFHKELGKMPLNADIPVNLNLGTTTLQLHLKPGKVFSDGAYLAEQDGTFQLWQDLSNDGVYRGFVGSDTTQSVALYVAPDFVSGYINTPTASYTLKTLRSLVENAPANTEDVLVAFTDYVSQSEVFTCLTPEPTGDDAGSETGDDGGTSNRDEPFNFVEVGYDIDKLLYDRYVALGGSQPIRMAMHDVVEKHLEVEKLFRKAYANVFFRIAHIQVWTSINAPYPYFPVSNSITTHWSRGKSYWKGNKDCVSFDVVVLLSNNQSLNAEGVVMPNGVNSICGIPIGQVYSERAPFAAVKYLQPIAVHIAHELGHNFGLLHVCDCVIMHNSASATSGCTNTCSSLSPAWDDNNKLRLINRFKDGKPKVTDINYTSTFPSNSCLLNEPPVDYLLKMEADNVIINNKTFVCPGQVFKVTYFNQTDPAPTNLSWELGPHLSLSGPQNKITERTLVVDQNACCYAAETWVRVTFEFNCGIVTFERKIKLNGTFGLEGVYTPVGGPTYTLQSWNQVAPGSYRVELEHEASNYTWVRTIAGFSTPLSNNTQALDFGITAGQTITYTVSAPNDCGDLMQRIFTFTVPSGLAQTTNHNISDITATPNPFTDRIWITAENPASEIKMELFDMAGRCVATNRAQGVSRYEWMLPQLPVGNYILRVINNGFVISQKIAKQ